MGFEFSKLDTTDSCCVLVIQILNAFSLNMFHWKGTWEDPGDIVENNAGSGPALTAQSVVWRRGPAVVREP